MCSGTISVGSTTSSIGNSGKPCACSESRFTGSRPPSGQQQVVEEDSRQPWLEHGGVEPLQSQIAMECVLAPQGRDVLRACARLQAAVEPAKPVRGQLFTPDPDVGEAARA